MPPAARMSDITAHGGAITSGFLQVLIGGQPAARVGDTHTCPLATPGTPPVPHVGGPILPPGSPTVFIGGQPAARVGDSVFCVVPPGTPPDKIATGCLSVIIGP